MRRIAYGLLILACIAAACGHSAADDYSFAYQAYMKYERAEFRCVLPADWEQLATTPEIAAASKMSKAVVYRDADPMRVSISIEFFGGDNLMWKSMDAYIRNLTLPPAGMRQIEEEVKINETEVAGMKAKAFDRRPFKGLSRFHSNEFRMRERYVVLPTSAGFYVLKMEAPEKIISSYAPVFDKMVESFEPIPKTPPAQPEPGS